MSYDLLLDRGREDMTRLVCEVEAGYDQHEEASGGNDSVELGGISWLDEESHDSLQSKKRNGHPQKTSNSQNCFYLSQGLADTEHERHEYAAVGCEGPDRVCGACSGVHRELVVDFQYVEAKKQDRQAQNECEDVG